MEISPLKLFIFHFFCRNICLKIEKSQKITILRVFRITWVFGKNVRNTPFLV